MLDGFHHSFTRGPADSSRSVVHLGALLTLSALVAFTLSLAHHFAPIPVRSPVSAPVNRDIRLVRAPAPALRIVHDLVTAQVQVPLVQSLDSPTVLHRPEDSLAEARPTAPAALARGIDAVPATQPRPAGTGGDLPNNVAVSRLAATPIARGLDPSLTAPTSSSVAVPAIEPTAGASDRVPAAIDQGRLVRETLKRYEEAYNNLDASAAQDVWPSVNLDALAKAFSGLTEQNVTLSHCDVQVTGSAGRADCTGTARWTPRVGGGSHFESRRWSFQLKGDQQGWTIVSATVR
jgi:hypothetical protein